VDHSTYTIQPRCVTIPDIRLNEFQPLVVTERIPEPKPVYYAYSLSQSQKLSYERATYVASATRD